MILPGNGGPIDGLFGAGQNDRISHERGHYRIQEVVRSLSERLLADLILLSL